ncbi:MAG: sugar phosphate nucleotidyltransferase, partial [Bacteroidota bacterium]
MNAMIFAAGLGSRLSPLTDEKPKALIEVNGRPLLEIALRKMEHAGMKKVVVNIHHHREQMLHFLESFQSSGMEIMISDEKDQLLDTGGGLMKARHLFDPDASV